MNVSMRGKKESCLCNGGWTNFCGNGDILSNLERNPYPHDKRCGCCICPDCRVGIACELCDGDCVVCLGKVTHGPSDLTDLIKWNPQPQKTVIKLTSELTLYEGLFYNYLIYLFTEKK